jgi:hypothetical protein
MDGGGGRWKRAGKEMNSMCLTWHAIHTIASIIIKVAYNRLPKVKSNWIRPYKDILAVELTNVHTHTLEWKEKENENHAYLGR